MNVAARTSSCNIISLCTGGGGLDLGIELAMPTARSCVLVEREAFSVAHLVSAMQTGVMAPAPIWSDVRTFNGRPWRGLVDGLIGGIPCQPHSLAGKQLGEEDERDLWSDARRIIVQARPWFVVIENVRGILSSGGAERVWRDFRRLGFKIEGGLFTAAEVGASHERERFFVLAVADSYGEHDYWGREFRSRWRRELTDFGVELADSNGDAVGRSNRPGRIQSPPITDEGEAPGKDGEWSRTRSRNDSEDVGYADSTRLEGWDSGELRQRSGERLAGSHGGELVNTTRDGRREGRTKSEFRSGRDSASGASAAVGHTIGGGHDGDSQGEFGGSLERVASEWPGRGSFPALYPPGPSDLESWRAILGHSPELEPAVRRMADGVATRLDHAGPHAARVERLRMLGNGVVSLQAAYAIRTLATRLAATGSAGAARLVRMMEQTEMEVAS